jgi:hypothetical protein
MEKVRTDEAALLTCRILPYFAVSFRMLAVLAADLSIMALT